MKCLALLVLSAILACFLALTIAIAQNACTVGTQSGCFTIPNTSIGVGTTCISRSSFPALNSPVDPRVNYGADPTGVANSASAFQSAVNSGHDVHVTCPTAAACTYMISDNNGTNPFPVTISTSVNIQCDASVTLYLPDNDAIATGLFTFQGANGGGVQGCSFKGSNAGSGPLNLGANGHEYDYLIYAIDSSNLLFEGNTFGNTWANAAIIFTTGDTGPGVTNTIVQYNTFTANPFYALGVTSGGHITFQNNYMVDNWCCVEANHESNDATAMTGHISITNNYLEYVKGTCERAGNVALCNWGDGITAGDTVDGEPAGATYPYYGTNSATFNYVVGTDPIDGESALIFNQWKTNPPDAYTISPPPTYSNNILGPGAVCANGVSC